MGDRDSNFDAVNALFGVLVMICIALSGFSLKWTFDANAELKVIRVEMRAIHDTLEKLSQNSEADKKQDSQLSKHWRLHTWAREEINRISVRDGSGIVSWPDLSGGSRWE